VNTADKITVDPLPDTVKAETYISSKQGCVEYGWVFGYANALPSDGYEALFDFPLGETGTDTKFIESEWERTKPLIEVLETFFNCKNGGTKQLSDDIIFWVKDGTFDCMKSLLIKDQLGSISSDVSERIQQAYRTFKALIAPDAESSKEI
jgi:hypothetical protein